MQIHQVVVSARAGDAITNSAIELRTLLRRLGPSDIYARYIDPTLEDVHPLPHLARRWSSRPRDDVVVFHASIGEPELFQFILDRPERLVLVYHNISPPEYFVPYDPAFAGLLENGRKELVKLRDRVTVALCVSPFNARELVEIGYRDVRVSPLVVDPISLRDTEPHDLTTNHLSTQVQGPLALFVGQLLPHKRPDFLLRAYHRLVTYLDPDAHLVVVGSAPLARYRNALLRFTRELNLSRAWITGPIPQSQLVAFYRRADVFVTASEHEGFCVPLLEAMAFEVPIVARGFAAVPETLSGAGVVVPPTDGAEVVAEATHEVLVDAPLRAELVARGLRRLDDFAPDRARAAFLENLADVL